LAALGAAASGSALGVLAGRRSLSVDAYAGSAGTGITVSELKRLAQVLAPLQVSRMPLAAPPPREVFQKPFFIAAQKCQ
jgi:hypothetical protein